MLLSTNKIRLTDPIIHCKRLLHFVMMQTTAGPIHVGTSHYLFMRDERDTKGQGQIKVYYAHFHCFLKKTKTWQSSLVGNFGIVFPRTELIIVLKNNQKNKACIIVPVNAHISKVTTQK